MADNEHIEDGDDRERAARAYDLIVPDEKGTNYTEAGHLLARVDGASFAQEIASRTGATPEGAVIMADALIWFVGEYHEVIADLAEAREEIAKLRERLGEDDEGDDDDDAA